MLSANELEQLRIAAGDAARLLKVMGNPDRLLLLCQLAQGEYNVGKLEEILALQQPSLSQQLAELRKANLVSTRREGKQVYYSLTHPAAITLMQTLHQLFCSTVKP